MSYPSSKFPIVFVTFAKVLALSSFVTEPWAMENPLEISKMILYVKYSDIYKKKNGPTLGRHHDIFSMYLEEKFRLLARVFLLYVEIKVIHTCQKI